MIALYADLSMRRQWALIGLARSGVYSAEPRRVLALMRWIDEQ